MPPHFDEMHEEWRQIPNFPGFEASSLGRIRNRGTGKIRKTYATERGYLRIRLHSAAGRYTTVPVHRLVAAAFLGPIPDKHQVNHKNAIKLDNGAANLEYVTNEENREHALQNGLFGVLTQELVFEARRLKGLGHTKRQIAAAMALPTTTIHSALYYKKRKSF